MKLKFVLPSVLVLAAAGILAFQSFGKTGISSDSKDKQALIADLMSQVLEKYHYSPKDIDDEFSQEVFKRYLEQMDDGKKFFYQSDIDYLKKYETEIDDELQGFKPLSFYEEADSILNLRVKAAKDLYPEVLDKPFNFNLNDSVQIDRSGARYPEDEVEFKELWKKELKYRTLGKLIDLQKMKEKAPDTAAIKKKDDQALEVEAREDIKKSFDLFFDRLESHFTKDERFGDFLNVVAGCMDPHTNYFSPKNKRYFDEQMSGTFFGIGAVLTQSDYYVKIENIVTGGPAWKQGDLKAGDLILKVGQGEDEPVDMTGYTTEDAVKIIRGKKNTVVNLTVKHEDGSIQTIGITRDEVKIEATFAHSYVIDEGGKKIGFLVLPEFYFNNKGTTGPGSSAYDVQQELKKLKAQDVDGVIMDLRFNGGGSLGDAIDMVGLFVPKGPVVQVRSGNGSVDVLKSHNSEVEYSGPLAIMVNEYSASASEILSAAMQDYHRAVIVGSKKTYGKGTVQRMIDLSSLLSSNQKVQNLGSLGALKMTIQKFYRISGGSTQLKGVTSDIILPDPYYNVAEKESKDALPWDQIDAASFKKWTHPLDLDYLKEQSKNRVENSSTFSMIEKNIETIKSIRDEKTVSLNLEKFKAMQKANSEAVNEVKDGDTTRSSLVIKNLQEDLPKIGQDSILSQRNRVMLKAYRSDPYLRETVNVVNDLVGKQEVKMHKLTSAEKKEN